MKMSNSADISANELKAKALARLAGKRPSRSYPKSQTALPDPKANYQKRLKLNRNYEELMLMDSFPVVEEDKGIDLFARDEEAEKQKEKLRERARKSIKSKGNQGKKQALGSGNDPWCARCNRKHSIDFHKTRLPRCRPAELPALDNNSDSGSDLADFIVPDGPVGRKNIHKRRAAEDYSDMEAGFEEIMEEEQRSALLGQKEDEAALSHSTRL